jgi:pyridoxal phosphate enzyme (YggS family)
MTSSGELPRRLEAVRERMARACHRSGREPASVVLVAITKTHPATTIREALAAGCDVFGENRIQEALAKMPDVGQGARWHFVGHLQSNKARHAVGAFELIHGVSDLRLARELDQRAAAAGLTQRVLVEVNLAREATKHGVAEEDLHALLDGMMRLEHLELEGLMAIPPPVERADESRPWFARLRELRDRSAARLERALPELSMGMTDDFEVAIEEGATLVRVGRAIFGERN